MTQPMLAAADPAGWTFNRYEQIRSRLPSARFAQSMSHCGSLRDIAEQFDAFIFDSFGVLNVGDSPIPGAAKRIAELRKNGKRVLVLTNAASNTITSLPDKYRNLGLDFTQNEIVSSREVLSIHLAQTGYQSFKWDVIAPAMAQISELGADCRIFQAQNDTRTRADGFILLSSAGWTQDHMRALKRALRDRPRPVLVGNPDLVAPRETGLSLEPGLIAHELLDEIEGLNVQFFGKPFVNAFDRALDRFPPDIDRRRIAMVGDTLHTDILGGAAAGLQTVLVTGWGVLRGTDVDNAIDMSGIVPDYAVPSV